VQTYKYDRWKNQVYHKNSRGDITTQEFRRNKVYKVTQPEVPVTDEQGNTKTENLITIYGYGLSNELLGVQDANNHTEGYVRDEAQQTLKHVLGDGTLNEQNEIDIFSNTIIRYGDFINGQYQPWVQIFNRRNKLTQQKTPSGRPYGFAYDELDHRIAQSYPSGATDLYSFDVFGDMDASYLPTGLITKEVLYLPQSDKLLPCFNNSETKF
jgi:YD repeat-containing protein